MTFEEIQEIIVKDEHRCLESYFSIMDVSEMDFGRK